MALSPRLRRKIGTAAQELWKRKTFRYWEVKTMPDHTTFA
jgi:REP element-mobilizing transposase RayT